MKHLKCVRKNEKGVVMIAVLIIALAVAIFSYSLLMTSMNSLERADVQDYRVKADASKEGAIDESAYAFKQNPDFFALPDNPDILPESAGGSNDATIKAALLSDNGTYAQQWDDFPKQTVRSAKAEHQNSTFDTPDLYFVWGDTEQATYEFLDDLTYKRHFFDYHFNPYEQDSDVVISAGAEVDDGLNDRVFSFGSRNYNTDITRFQERTNDAWEPNENDPEKTFYQSEHSSYDVDTTTRYWTLTYSYDPEHPGRDIKRIDLLAAPGDVSIGSPGDIVWTTGWDGFSFDPPTGVAPNYVTGPYTNPSNVITQNINATTLRVGMISDDIVDAVGQDYGFKVNGLRYYYGGEEYPLYYETPHPYDHIPATPFGSPAIQVVFSPAQLDPFDPQAANQRLRISLDWKFELESGDTLTVVNLADPNPFTSTLATLTLSDGAGQTYEARRIDTTVPLAIGLMFTSDGDNATSTDNYGYKVESMEYTNTNGDWVLRTNPLIETPHLGNLGSFINLLDPTDALMHNVIYQPHVPGGGTLNEWSVHFDEGASLWASNNSDSDFIRVTTPGYDPFLVGSDIHYFVPPGGMFGYGSGFLGNLANYHEISMLDDFDYDCGTSQYIEIYCRIDNQGEYANVADNWGYRTSSAKYTANNASDVVNEAPTIAAAVSLAPDKGYTNFGAGIGDRGEWWVIEKGVEMVGFHIDLTKFDLDLGDYLLIQDADGNEIGAITALSFDPDLPQGSGPGGFGNIPGGSGPDPGIPYGSGPGNTVGFDAGTINLNSTHGWVLVPGESAHIMLIGDGDDNGTHKGFQVDRTAWWSGNVNYDTTGAFQKLDNLGQDFADYSFSSSGEYKDIR